MHTETSFFISGFLGGAEHGKVLFAGESGEVRGQRGDGRVSLHLFQLRTNDDLLFNSWILLPNDKRVTLMYCQLHLPFFSFRRQNWSCVAAGNASIWDMLDTWLKKRKNIYEKYLSPFFYIKSHNTINNILGPQNIFVSLATSKNLISGIPPKN